MSQQLNNYKERKQFWDSLSNTLPEQMLRGYLEQLPKPCAEVLFLHYLEQNPLPQIAQQLNKSITTIRNRHDLGIFLLSKLTRILVILLIVFSIAMAYNYIVA